MSTTHSETSTLTTPRRFLRRFAIAVIVVVAGVTVYFTNQLLTQRFTETTRNRAEIRAALYMGNLLSELQRNSIVPQLLARDPELTSALQSNDYSRSTLRLLSFVEEINAASLKLLDLDGRTVASTERNLIGQSYKSQPYFVQALRSNATVFSVVPRDSTGYSFIYARRIDQSGQTLGVLTVEVDLRKLERAWAGVADSVVVTDSEGTIILSTNPRWYGQLEGDALAAEDTREDTAVSRAFRATQSWRQTEGNNYLLGEAVIRREVRVPFQGWRMITYTSYTSVRDKVNGVIALEIMGFALLLALLSWYISRRTASRMVLFQRESEKLRALNLRLQREIAARERAERTLEVTEQSLAQSSKLAALGEMSAAVSHELNQPLAAMKTYLAGAKLLVQRKRHDETMASFKRIDDLIERMGAITKQLKSYARKGGDEFQPVDVIDALNASLAMMDPQLNARKVEIVKTIPQEDIFIFGDKLRLEQVIINLLRNALDATKSVADPKIEILLVKGDMMTLSVQDNGPGIEDLNTLFEPFYTTKQPGEGVGLGLAISSGIAGDLGGRLLARNAPGGGAVFELQLPIYSRNQQAAE